MMYFDGVVFGRIVAVRPARPASVAGWSSLVARRAHNPEVVGSNPTPAIDGQAVRRTGGQAVRDSGGLLSP